MRHITVGMPTQRVLRALTAKCKIWPQIGWLLQILNFHGRVQSWFETDGNFETYRKIL